jgi:hypothetical protein
LSAEAARRPSLYAPTPAAIAQELPAVGRNVAEALQGLSDDPSHARAGLVAMQLHGAIGLVRKLQEAIQRQGDADDGQER